MRSAHFFVGAAPVESAVRSASEYMRSRALPERPEGHADPHSIMTPSVGSKIAEAFKNAPDHDPSAVPAYNAMREEINRQFDHMTGPRSKGGMGLDVRIQPHDPYGSGGDGSRWDKAYGELRHDVEHNNRLDVLSTKVTGGVPHLSDEDNDKFRAIHDVFGHLAAGRGVDYHGEEAAWKHHVTMFSDLAARAVTTDLRGFNNTMRVSPKGTFPANKVAILPDHLRDPALSRMGSAQERAQAAEQARGWNKRQGII